MSRSGYSDDCETWALIRWRGAVSSAIRGERGQAFLREMLEALDALPEHKLIAEDLVRADGFCCAMGAVALKRGADVSKVDPECREQVADLFGIAPALSAEIAFVNDEQDWRGRDTPEERFSRVRAWVVSQIKQESFA